MVHDVIYKYCSVLDHNAEINSAQPLPVSEEGDVVALEQHARGSTLSGELVELSVDELVEIGVELLVELLVDELLEI